MNLNILDDQEVEELYKYVKNRNIRIVVSRLQTKRLLCNTCPFDVEEISNLITTEYAKRSSDVPRSDD